MPPQVEKVGASLRHGFRKKEEENVDNVIRPEGWNIYELIPSIQWLFHTFHGEFIINTAELRNSDDPAHGCRCGFIRTARINAHLQTSD